MARGAADGVSHPVDCHVGRRVSEKRVSLGFNQSELGKALGVSFQQVQKYEKGWNRISASKLWEIAQFLKVDIDYFFDGLPKREGVTAEGGGVDLDGGFPITPQALEISRLAPKLAVRAQRISLNVIRAFVERAASTED